MVTTGGEAARRRRAALLDRGFPPRGARAAGRQDRRLRLRRGRRGALAPRREGGKGRRLGQPVGPAPPRRVPWLLRGRVYTAADTPSQAAPLVPCQSLLGIRIFRSLSESAWIYLPARSGQHRRMRRGLPTRAVFGRRVHRTRRRRRKPEAGLPTGPGLPTRAAFGADQPRTRRHRTRRLPRCPGLTSPGTADTVPTRAVFEAGQPRTPGKGGSAGERQAPADRPGPKPVSPALPTRLPTRPGHRGRAGARERGKGRPAGRPSGPHRRGCPAGGGRAPRVRACLITV